MSLSSSSRFLTKHGYLSLLIPPIFVYILATTLFELSLNTNGVEWTAAISAHIASQDVSTLSFDVIEMKVRYIWFTTVLLNFVICLYAASSCGIIIYRSHTDQRLITIIAIGSLLIVLGIVGLIYSAATRNAMFELIYHSSLSILQATGVYKKAFLTHVDVLLALTNTLAVIVPSIVLLAASSTLAPSPKQNRNDFTHLTTQMRHLKSALNAGSALLVSGILHMGAWLRWPAGLQNRQRSLKPFSQLRCSGEPHLH